MGIFKEAQERAMKNEAKRDPMLKSFADEINNSPYISVKAKVSYGSVFWKIPGRLDQGAGLVSQIFGRLVYDSIVYTGKDSFEADLGEYILDAYEYKGEVEFQIRKKR